MAKQEKNSGKNENIEKGQNSDQHREQHNNRNPNIQNKDWSRVDEGYKPIKDTAEPNPPTSDTPSDTPSDKK
jgi:hypothetical protein